MLNVIGVNGAVIKKENKQTKIIRKEFLFALGKALVAKSCKRRLYETNIPQTMKVRIQDIFSFPIKRARHDVHRKLHLASVRFILQESVAKRRKSA